MQKDKSIHFDTPLSDSCRKMAKGIKCTACQRDIRVLAVEEVADDFHARFDATGKRYRYIWDCNAVQSPFRTSLCS